MIFVLFVFDVVEGGDVVVGSIVLEVVWLFMDIVVVVLV